MAYRNKKSNNRINDPSQIGYVKAILQQAEQQTQSAGMYSPEVYIATAQQLANQYTAQDNRYPVVIFDMKEQKLRNQEGSVPELTATIGNKTSSSYFIIKDSLPPGTFVPQEQLTQLRPDVVSARIAVNLGIAQTPTPASSIPPIPNTAIPPIPNAISNPTQTTSPSIPTQLNVPTQPNVATQPNTGLSKAQMLAQQMGITAEGSAGPTNPVAGLAVVPQAPAVPPIANQAVPPVSPTPNQAVDAFSQLVTSAVPTPEQTTQAPANKNPYANVNQNQNQNQTAPAPAPAPAPVPATEPLNQVTPIHNRQISQVMKSTNQNLQAAGKLNQNIGQVLKDLAKGEINPIQLYGDTLKTIGNFLEGIPEGFNEARIARITEQMNQVNQKKANIERKMDRLGNSFLEAELSSVPVNNGSAPVLVETVPNPAPSPSQTNKPSVPNTTKSDTVKEKTAIDKLLESNASIEDKLDAIEKTLDKMLEKLNLIEKSLAQIEASLKEQNQASTASANLAQENTVTETEVSTQVEAVVTDPKAEVPVKTEIETEIVAEVKTETQAAQDVEVPARESDSPLDEVAEVNAKAQDAEVNAELIDLISSFEGDMDSLNHHLVDRGLQVNKSEDGQFVFVSEVNNGIVSPVFEAEANGERWDIKSGIDTDTKLSFMESFIEAEEASIASSRPPEVEPEKAPSQESESVLSIG